MGLLKLLLLINKWLLDYRRSRNRLRSERVTLRGIDAMMESYRRGDYQTALQAAEDSRQYDEVTAVYCFYRGSILSSLGRLEEAKIWLWRSISLRDSQDKRHIAIAHTSLGQALMLAGRYDEAAASFQASVEQFPERGEGYRSMAELALLRGNHSSEAVRLARLAIEKQQAEPGISEELRRLNFGETYGTLAWAIAADSHDAAEVSRLATEAVDSVGEGPASSAAQVHYHAGLAFLEIGDSDRSTHHYQEAARIDPQGNWGRAAKAALAAKVAP